MTLLEWLKGLGSLLRGGPGLVETYGVEELRRTEDWEACLQASEEGPLFVFKHSTACPVSAAAHQRVARYLAQPAEGDAPVYLVRVIESRPLSNAIAQDLGVRHQSPQVLLLHARRPVWDASHGGVNETAMRQALAETGG